MIRKAIDRNYSEDQVFFSRKELKSVFEKAGYKVDRLVYMGYFSVPFAQIMLKPAGFFIHFSRLSIRIDRWLHSWMNNRLAWNMVILVSF
jgi:hypothetical protein